MFANQSATRRTLSRIHIPSQNGPWAGQAGVGGHVVERVACLHRQRSCNCTHTSRSHTKIVNVCDIWSTYVVLSTPRGGHTYTRRAHIHTLTLLHLCKKNPHFRKAILPQCKVVMSRTCVFREDKSAITKALHLCQKSPYFHKRALCTYSNKHADSGSVIEYRVMI